MKREALEQVVKPEIEVGLMTGGGDKPYAFGLAMALLSKGVRLDFIGSDQLDSPEFHAAGNLRFLNLRGDQRQDVSPGTKVKRIVLYYARLIRYAAVARPKIFHILWNSRFRTFDRTLLMLYYKLLGKKVVFTAHNVNDGKRDANDSLLNRVTLKVQYRLCDHIFVHTEKMKRELLDDFGVREQAVTVIPFGINNAVPRTDVSSAGARQRLGLSNTDRVILFFGMIGPYKGLEFLVQAFQSVSRQNAEYRLLIAGQYKEECEAYRKTVTKLIDGHVSRDRIVQKIEFVPDEETELYFKAADVLVLPYTYVCQSGVLFLGYSFGLPVIATDVGSLREEVVESRTGFVCKPCDAADLAGAIQKYFASDLFKELDSRRCEIRDYAEARNSWNVVGEITRNVYAELLGEVRDETVGIDTHSCVQRPGMDR